MNPLQSERSIKRNSPVRQCRKGTHCTAHSFAALAGIRQLDGGVYLKD
jgi:hypothetical protein